MGRTEGAEAECRARHTGAMFKRGKKGEEKEGKKKATKQERKLAAEMAEKAELMRAAGISMPDPKPPVVSANGESTPPTTPLRTPGGLLKSSQRSTNKARERMGQQKKVKLSFKDRLTDKVASGQKSALHLACAVIPLSPIKSSDSAAARTARL